MKTENNFIQPIEVMGVYDNKGHTLDNYSIWLLFDDGGSFLVTTNSVSSVWDIGEGYAVDVDSLDEESSSYDEIYHINTGEEINWEGLPIELQKTITSYFEGQLSYIQ